MKITNKYLMNNLSAKRAKKLAFPKPIKKKKLKEYIKPFVELQKKSRLGQKKTKIAFPKPVKKVKNINFFDMPDKEKLHKK